MMNVKRDIGSGKENQFTWFSNVKERIDSLEDSKIGDGEGSRLFYDQNA